MHTILNSKGDLTGSGLPGYGLVSIHFNRSIQYSCLLTNIFVVVSKDYNLAVEDYIMCELIGRESCRHLNTFSNLLTVAVYYTYQYMLCIVAIVNYPCTPCCPLLNNHILLLLLIASM